MRFCNGGKILLFTSCFDICCLTLGELYLDLYRFLPIFFLTVGVWMSVVAYGRNARLGDDVTSSSPFRVLRVFLGLSVFVRGGALV